MKIIQIVWGISFFMLFSCKAPKEKSYPEADAVYLSLTKTFVLNKDGSILNSVEKRQKLFTYRAFQSLYGETRIPYNPEIQKLVVSEAYTTNAENQTINTPENGYNEVLPTFCQDSKAYSNLREMVVSHTGLERNAVIKCTYNITTASGKTPFLMGMEELQADCPIDNLTIVVKVQPKMKLHYKLLNLTSEPIIDQGKDFDTYTWNFQDLPQRRKEIRSASVCEDIPTLLFTTQKDISAAINWVLKSKSSPNSINKEIKKYVDTAIKDKKSLQEKALAIQKIVVNELKTLHIPASLVAFQARPEEEVWKSNSGTVLEKAFLLSYLLRLEGLNADVCLNIPEDLLEEQRPLLLAAEPIVKIDNVNGEIMLLTADRLNAGNLDLGIPPFRILTLNAAHKVFSVNKPTGIINVEGKLIISRDGKLQGELTGQFSGRFNPYFEIIRNQGKCPPLLSDFTGSTGKLTADQANVSFKVEKMDQLLSRGDFRFLDLKESKSGISSFHLVSMPFTRTSALYLGTPIDESYHYTINLPANWQLVNPVNIEFLKPGIGHVMISLKQSGSVIEAIRKIRIFSPVIAKKDYSEFRELIDKWSTQKFKQLIIK